MKKFLFLAICAILSTLFSYSKTKIDSVSIKQTTSNIERINLLLDSIKKINNDIQRLSINTESTNIIEAMLKPAYSYTDTFKQIKKIGKVFSPDKKFNIITWNIPLMDGQNIFFGFIQINPGKDSLCKLFKLNDFSYTTDKIDMQVEFTSEQWLGALYYDIIHEKINKKEVYVLLGSRLNDLKTNKKIIETLYFNQNGLPVFGKPVLEYNSNLQSRIIFEYAIAISMTLRYNQKVKMIVFDHLSPSSPVYKGDYKFYGPDFSYDGLKFMKDRWVYVPDIKVY